MDANNPEAASSGGCRTLYLVPLLPAPCVGNHFIETSGNTKMLELTKMKSEGNWPQKVEPFCGRERNRGPQRARFLRDGVRSGRSEEHTSELQSRLHLVCRLLLEKKNT